ncbi:unnamed protein product [Rodentolepis nana]|uniref:G_PROTEIN_RECEP_F1_2 domain-containing protein n=1 Tax=Rodentolepis nana TaxID=102285 RepID=A0A0R3TQF3_RODNA|nr:unnamed protein product [Rodentolepis nana]
MLEKLQTTSGAQIATQDRKPVDIYYSMIFKIGYVYMQPCICIIGFVLNIINSYIFCRKTFSSTPAYMLVSALSITDAITLGLRIPQGLTQYVIKLFSFHHLATTEKHRYRGSQTAKTIAINAYIYATYAEIPITNMTENMSAWLTVCLALERYVAMRHWNFARQYCNRRNATRLIIGIAAVSIIFNLPYFMIHRINVQRSQNGTLKVTSSVTALKRSKFYAIYSWFRMATVQIIPLVALCILNVLLIAIVYHHNKKLDKKSELERNINRLSLGGDVLTSEEGCISDPSKNEVIGIQQQPPNTFQKKRNAQRKLNILLIAVILLFLFGAIPQAFSYARIFEVFGICKEDFHNCRTYSIYRMVTTNIALISYGLTFFLYISLNRHFRNELAKCMPICIKKL